LLTHWKLPSALSAELRNSILKLVIFRFRP
jgi:hypothetical protein